MRILICILYSIENEYEECKKSIFGQTYKNYDTFTIEQMPKKQAHDRIFQTFMDRANQFDLFIKIDADMVLCRTTLFSEIVNEVNNHPDYDHFQIAVRDHFTNKLIYGLNVYRSTVKWSITTEKLFTDRTYEATKCKKYIDVNEPLVPAADHCPNPSPFQSFHFGVHKAAKLMQREANNILPSGAGSHARNLYDVSKNLSKSKDPVLLYSMAGAFWALNISAGAKEVDFSSAKTQSAFKYFTLMNPQAFKKHLKKEFFAKKMFLPRDYWVFYMINRYTLQKSTMGALFSGLVRMVQKYYGIKKNN